MGGQSPPLHHNSWTLPESPPKPRLKITPEMAEPRRCLAGVPLIGAVSVSDDGLQLVARQKFVTVLDPANGDHVLTLVRSAGSARRHCRFV